MGNIKDNNSLSSDEIWHLSHLLSELNTSMGSTSTYVHSGMASKAQFPSWIIDSGANRHMTSSSKVFSNYSSLTNGENVRIADGSISSVRGIGSMSCTPDLTLSSVLRALRQACLGVSKDAHQEIIQWHRRFPNILGPPTL
ncbi:Retrovirus-related Pol polyprotein from transposon TNT 1-94 [Senna tora]|uniref:Retrovirus-related Pol polyprotein from transposon TNT 1-94 n=1 Tax=Senna tora TaxID=362788 RepID=A0A834T6U2_9FABA|nr:Retrovirus-related Pol polyprotein from transposon TNT 1-94 [Senna tora]